MVIKLKGFVRVNLNAVVTEGRLYRGARKSILLITGDYEVVDD